jgi:hypothetical protein
MVDKVWRDKLREEGWSDVREQNDAFWESTDEVLGG